MPQESINIPYMSKTNLETRDYRLEEDCLRLSRENAKLIDFVYLASSSVRPDGTYNNCREALEKKAKQLLTDIGL